jgi:hypothetical protein
MSDGPSLSGAPTIPLATLKRPHEQQVAVLALDDAAKAGLDDTRRCIAGDALPAADLDGAGCAGAQRDAGHRDAQSR